MSWVVEQLHRDGSVLNRFAIPDRDSPDASSRTFRIGRAIDGRGGFLVLDVWRTLQFIV